jgi:HlyD family secretion protein
MKCATISFAVISLVWIGLASYVAMAARKPCPDPCAAKVERATPVPGLRTVRVKRRDRMTMISATGTMKPQEAVEVGAQLTGMITRFGVDADGKPLDFGSKVHKGDALAYIDDTIYKAQLDSAEASLVRARADLVQYKARRVQAMHEWERAKSLVPDKAIAQSDFDLIETNYEVAQSNVDVGAAAIQQCEAAKRIAEATLEHTVIRSPIDGMIIDRRIDIGQTVVVSFFNAPGLFLIAKDLHRMQVWASVKESDIHRIHRGTPVRITVDAQPDEAFNGKVACVRPNATRAQSGATFTVIVDVNNSDDWLPNQTANLQFEVERRSVLLVPDDAFRKPTLFVSEESGVDGMAASNAPAGTADPGIPSAARPLRALAAQARKVLKHLWIRAGDSIRPVEVEVGNSDGSMTEVVGSNVKEGMEVVLGDSHPASGA